jgi:hypothetical protein
MADHTQASHFGLALALLAAALANAQPHRDARGKVRGVTPYGGTLSLGYPGGPLSVSSRDAEPALRPGARMRWRIARVAQGDRRAGFEGRKGLASPQQDGGSLSGDDRQVRLTVAVKVRRRGTAQTMGNGHFQAVLEPALAFTQKHGH